MTEAEFTTKVIKECHRLGLLVFHSVDTRRDIGKGFPDLVIAGPSGHLFVELKVPGGRMRPEQTDWAWKLRAGAPWCYEVWTPEELEWAIPFTLKEMADAS